MIEISRLTKDFGTVHAVRDLSFVVQPGRVTGFLGPNGAGKTTTLRCLLGLVSPTSGSATIDGRRYVDLEEPSRVVGAALEATGFHPGRTGRDHLRVIALAAGIELSRVDEVLGLVGLSDAADRRAGGYSLGMRQRLQLAAALLGEPQVLVLDEPANGLDPEGVAWLRTFLRYLAGQGRTVLISSHVLSEVEQTVDDVVIINRGQLVRAAPLEELTSAGRPVVVRSPQAKELAAALQSSSPDVNAELDGGDALTVHGLTTADVGRIALTNQVELHELRDGHSDLESVFFSLVEGEAS
jgi:ABC-2 type transport system ATP-binding protein